MTKLFEFAGKGIHGYASICEEDSAVFESRMFDGGYAVEELEITSGLTMRVHGLFGDNYEFTLVPHNDYVSTCSLERLLEYLGIYEEEE